MTEDELRALVRDVIASRATPQPSEPAFVRLRAHVRLAMVAPTAAGSPA